MNTEEFVKFIYNEDGTIKNLYNILEVDSDIKKIELCNIATYSIPLYDNDGFFHLAFNEKKSSYKILRDDKLRRVYDDLLTANISEGILNDLKGKSIFASESRRVDLLLSEIRNLYFRFNNNPRSNDGFKRFIYNYGWEELKDSDVIFKEDEKKNSQLDILEINNFYVYNIKNANGNTIIVSKRYFDDFNKRTNIYGMELSTFAVEKVLLSNLKGLIWVVEPENSNEYNTLYYNSSYYYREKLNTGIKYADYNDKTQCLCLTKFEKTSNLPSPRVYVNAELYSHVEYNDDGTIKDKIISSSYPQYNIDSLYFNSLKLGREMYFDLLENNRNNAKNVIRLAFPGYFEEIMVEPYQKTKEYKRERGNVYYEHARIFDFHV